MTRYILAALLLLLVIVLWRCMRPAVDVYECWRTYADPWTDPNAPWLMCNINAQGAWANRLLCCPYEARLPKCRTQP